MAKKKVVVEEVEPVDEVVATEASPETVDTIKAKADQIAALFVGDYEGAPLDLDNPDHRIVAAWLVGKNGILRK